MPVTPSARWQRPPDVPGVPPVEWITEHDRMGWQTAKNARARIVKLVDAHGLAAVLTSDIVDLEGLWTGPTAAGARKYARRAQKILRAYHAEVAA